MKPLYETTGEVCEDKNDEFCQKAECLSHFSFEKSDKKLMLLIFKVVVQTCMTQRLRQWSCWQMGKYYFVLGTYQKQL